MPTPRKDLALNSELVMINNYLIDVSIKEDHSFDAEVTDYPVESGSSFSDNIRKKPITVTMEGLVSNSPLGDILLKRFGTTENAQALGSTQAGYAYATLLSVWNAGEPVTIRTSLGTFERMAMTGLNIPRDSQTGDALNFTASFQQIQTVTNERIRKKTATRTGKKRNLGAKASIGQDQPLIIWNKGRDVFNLDWKGGGTYRGDTEQIIYHKYSNGRTLLSHIFTFRVANSEGNLTGPSHFFFLPLTREEVARFILDRKRDEEERPNAPETDPWSHALEDKPTKKPLNDMSKRNTSASNYEPLSFRRR